MEQTLTKRSLFLIGIFVISIITFFVIKTMIDKLEIATNITYSATSLPTLNEAINEISNESANNSSANSSNQNKPSLKNLIEKLKEKLSNSDYKSVKSLYKQMTDHIGKLQKFKENPLKFDNQGLLKNAPNEAVRQKIINSRIKHLETEIKAFYDNIVKILSKVE